MAELRRDALALVTLGIPEQEIRRTMRAKDMTSDEINMVFNNRFQKYVPSQDKINAGLERIEGAKRREVLRAAITAYPDVQPLTD